MNYEEKYKNALRWIESIYPTLSSEQRMEAEGIFPEIAESEDERIRKEILDYLVSRGFSNEWIAWLKKQCEKNLANSAKTCKDDK